MKFKKIFLITLLLSTFLMLSAVSANDNLTDEGALQDAPSDEIELSEDVNEEIVASSEQNIIGEKDNGTFTALQNKIKNAASGATITLENDYTYDEGFDTKGIRIDKVLTINGNGHTINGLSKSRIIFITYTENSVTLNNITFYNGYSDDGGAIYSKGGTYDPGRVTINNCEFINNKATQGSAIAGAYLTISNSRFTNNNGFGAILVSFTTHILNCNFENNNGKAVQLSAFNDGHYLEVINCIFKNNNGGAIGSNTDATISSSTFDSNVGSEKGGAVYVFGDLTVSNSTFTNNRASKNGGAICHETEKLSIKNSKFINNQASENGGAVYTSGYTERWSSSSGTKISIYEGQIENSEFTGNNAGQAGGAIYSTTHTYGGVHYGVTVVKSTFSNNNAPTDKDISGGTATDCVFKNPPSSSSSTSKNTKLTPKLTAKKASFKVKQKTKKYTATLKTNKNKAMKKIKLYLKVKGKTYTAKTNNKGKAIFKIKNLKKRGTYKATVTFKGNSNYNKVTKTVKIKVK